MHSLFMGNAGFLSSTVALSPEARILIEQAVAAVASELEDSWVSGHA